MIDKIELNLLEILEKTLYAENWKDDTMLALSKYRNDNNIDDDTATGVFIDKIIWLIFRNRFVEARRRLKQELENTKGLTEELCKRRKVNETYCKSCKNYNCNLNINEEK